MYVMWLQEMYLMRFSHGKFTPSTIFRLITNFFTTLFFSFKTYLIPNCFLIFFPLQLIFQFFFFANIYSKTFSCNFFHATRSYNFSCKFSCNFLRNFSYNFISFLLPHHISFTTSYHNFITFLSNYSTFFFLSNLKFNVSHK